MNSDERAESLAAQTAAWVPPWERQARRDAEPAVDEALTADERAADETNAGDEAWAPGEAGEGVPPVPPLPGEVATPPTVDAPVEVPGEPELDPIDPEIPAPVVAEPADDGEGTPPRCRRRVPTR